MIDTGGDANACSGTAATGVLGAIIAETYEAHSRSRRADFRCGAIATIYAAGMIYAGGLTFLLLASLLYALGTALFLVARREQQVAVFTGREGLVFGAILLPALAAVCGLVTGTLKI